MYFGDLQMLKYAPLCLEEIKNRYISMEKNKATWPDSFPAELYKKWI
jgi:hypothetical protein